MKRVLLDISNPPFTHVHQILSLSLLHFLCLLSSRSLLLSFCHISPLSLLYLPLPNKIPNKTVVILNSYRSTTNRHEVLPPARHESDPRGEWSSPVLKHIKKIEFQESIISNPIRVLSVKLMAATQQSTDLRSSLQYFIDNTKTLTHVSVFELCKGAGTIV
jgi:hypothetical protein